MIFPRRGALSGIACRPTGAQPEVASLEAQLAAERDAREKEVPKLGLGIIKRCNRRKFAENCVKN